MIAVVDSGGTNLASVLFALQRLGAEAQLSSDADEIGSASKVILPGVGAAGPAMRALRQRGLVDCLRRLRQPVLGICLGMQLLFERSGEGDVECLGVLPGVVSRLSAAPGRPVPHMGWNRVRAVGGGSPWLSNDRDELFYFVHSFVAPASGATRGVADYGIEIPAVVHSGNWSGAQFHPERSGAAGHTFLRRFVEA